VTEVYEFKQLDNNLTVAEHDDDEAGCAAPVVLVSLRMWIHDKKWFYFSLGWMLMDLMMLTLNYYCSVRLDYLTLAFVK
jgi:hypothetical protein